MYTAFLSSDLPFVADASLEALTSIRSRRRIRARLRHITALQNHHPTPFLVHAVQGWNMVVFHGFIDSLSL